ncbi:uncharacterized protein LOC133783500 [Humulus lupulus]|uniref:uncharacterized protein LOC133783500 n=1 Tax=Humulus lupulus TaxID=3486 RepID=UPI002B40C64F|nr:uncharacterized protein LOC133783500 [Humulus lupulus]
MLVDKSSSSIQETHYDILSVKEDATYDEIRRCYRSAILKSHPDKLQNESEMIPPSGGNDNGNGCSTSEENFLKVQKAWEILSNPKSRSLYDSELRRALRQDDDAEEVTLEDMMVELEDEDEGNMIHFFNQCRCGDYFSVDSSDLTKMGYPLLMRRGKTKVISLQTTMDDDDALQPASILLPCGSCSLKIRLLINPGFCVTIH